MTRLALLSVLFLALPAAAADDSKLSKLLAVEPPKPAATDTELQKLMKERYSEVWNELVKTQQALAAGNLDVGGGGINSINNAANRLITSYLDLNPSRDDKLKMLENFVEYLKEVEGFSKKRYEAGALRPQEMHRATYYRLDAEIMLLKAKEAK